MDASVSVARSPSALGALGQLGEHFLDRPLDRVGHGLGDAWRIHPALNYLQNGVTADTNFSTD
jgi:hypothetical protein